MSVPEGTTSLRVSVDADSDLDLALKYGGLILSYADDGDWDYIDLETTLDPTIELSNPRAGVWYIDVMNLLDATKANYTLSVR